MIRPLTGQVLVQLTPTEQTTSGGLYLPDIAHDTPRGEKAKAFKGVVIAMGPWKQTRQGYGILPDFGIGHTVLCTPYRGTKIGRHLGERMQLVRSEDVLAVVESV